MERPDLDRGHVAAFPRIGPPERATPDRQLRVFGPDGGHELVRQNGIQLKLEALDRHVAADEVEQARGRLVRPSGSIGEFEQGRTPARP